MTSAFSWQNSISLCPVSFCASRPNLLIIPGVSWLPTFAFQFPVMKSKQKNEFQKKKIHFFDHNKAFDCVDHNKLWKILKEMRIPDHLTCLLRNLYTVQEATVITEYGITDWFQIRKGVCQGYILSPCLFNLYAEYIMWNPRLDEAPAGRNINNLRYAVDTTLMAESEEELKSLLMKVKEESEKVGLKLNITSWQIDGETMETVTDWFFCGWWGDSKNHCRWLLQSWN